MTRAADLAKLIAGGGSITVDDNSENLKLVTTDADASVGPTLRMDRQSASAADSDLLGKINFVGHNDAGTPEDIGYAGITAIISDASDGTEDGKLAINTMVAGTERSRIFVDASETVFNEDSQSIDFRVESDASAHGIFLDASEPSVGFGVGTADTVTAKMAIGLTGTVVSGSTDGATIGKASHVRLIDDTNWSSTDSTIFLLGGGTGGAIGQISSGIGFARESNSHWGTQLKFYTHPADTSDLDELTERMRIKGNGVVMIPGTHTDSSSSERVSISVTSGSINGINFIPTNSSGGVAIACRQTGGTGVGGVSFDNSSTSFNTSSDYRLKENVTTSWDATTRLKQLKPSRFNFKVDKDTTLDGFLAHEVSSIVPEAIKGEKDAMTKEVLYVEGEEIPEGKKVGDVKKPSKIDPQTIDHSKLVPLLVKTVQELEARLTALESK